MVKAVTESPKRCAWAERSFLERLYHDTEWGKAVHSDQRLFEFLVLEGAQAGLSWLTVLRRREAYRLAYHGFDPEKIAKFGPKEVERLLLDEGIIRNRLKIESSIRNAGGFLKVCAEFGSFDRYLWDFVEGVPIQNSWKTPADMPARTELSDRLSKDLRRRGFRFVGPVICYSYMQAVGLVSDHTVDCFLASETARAQT